MEFCPKCGCVLVDKNKTLLTILKLIAPITPFITEEIYQKHYAKKEGMKSIHLSEFEEIKINEDIKKGDHFLNILSKIRQHKTKNKKPMNAEIIITLPKEDLEKIKDMTEDLKDVTNAKEIKEGKFNIKFIPNL